MGSVVETSWKTNNWQRRLEGLLGSLQDKKLTMIKVKKNEGGRIIDIAIAEEGEPGAVALSNLMDALLDDCVNDILRAIRDNRAIRVSGARESP